MSGDPLSSRPSLQGSVRNDWRRLSLPSLPPPSLEPPIRQHVRRPVVLTRRQTSVIAELLVQLARSFTTDAPSRWVYRATWCETVVAQYKTTSDHSRRKRFSRHFRSQYSNTCWQTAHKTSKIATGTDWTEGLSPSPSPTPIHSANTVAHAQLVRSLSTLHGWHCVTNRTAPSLVLCCSGCLLLWWQEGPTVTGS